MKRILSLSVVLCLLFSLLALPASAEPAANATLTIQVVGGVYDNPGIVTGAGTYPVGTTVTVNAIPNMGFGFWSWSGEGDYIITEDPSYTFTITKDTLLIADFFKAPFDDICGTDYYFDPVLWAADEGITNGTAPATFAPEDVCTRAQIVTFLHRSVGCPMPMPGSPFIDVTGGEYYYDAVMWAYGSGITNGTSENTFSPEAGCTRAQVVTFLWRANGCPAPSAQSSHFVDLDASAYYYDAVLWALEKGITNGTSENTFSPEDTCTRGQIVTFLYRFLTASPLTLDYSSPSVESIPGEYADFWVTVSGGTAPCTYQWQYCCNYSGGWVDFTDEDWATGYFTDTISVATSVEDFLGAYEYRCVITDAEGSLVISPAVHIIEGLWIEVQPEDVFCNENESVTFNVGVSGGTAPYTYQWQYCYDGSGGWMDFTDELWADGYFSENLNVIVTSQDFADNYAYRCIVTDSNDGRVISYSASPIEAMG